MNLAEKIKMYLVKKEMGLSELCRKARVKQPTISKLIRQGTDPQLSNIFPLARAMGVPLEWLADDNQDWPPPPSDRERATEIVEKALAGAGLAGELTDSERQVIAALRALPEAARGEVIGYVNGLAAREAADAPLTPTDADALVDAAAQALRDQAVHDAVRERREKPKTA